MSSIRLTTSQTILASACRGKKGEVRRMLKAGDFRNSAPGLQGQGAVYSGWGFGIHTVCCSRKGKRRTEQDFLGNLVLLLPFLSSFCPSCWSRMGSLCSPPHANTYCSSADNRVGTTYGQRLSVAGRNPGRHKYILHLLECCIPCNDPRFTRFVTLLKQGPSAAERAAERLQNQCFSAAGLLLFL